VKQGAGHQEDGEFGWELGEDCMNQRTGGPERWEAK
jgi:hypothetical protein